MAMILTDAVKRNYKLFYEAGLADVFIVNYESLKKYFVSSIAKPTKWTLRDVFFRKEIEMFKSVIIDELHRCKSSQTHQSKFTKGITTGKKYVIGLTGTPVVNKPKDLVSQLFIINQMNQVFGNYRHFIDTYCAGTNEASNLPQLNANLRNNCFIRREKQEVLTDLPDKQRQVVVCDISNRKEYDDAEKDLIKYLVEYKDASDEKIASTLRGEIMVKIGILKNISARGKLNDVFEFVDDIMEAGEKLILFIHLKEVAAAVLHKYHGAVSITGADDMIARQSAVDRFQKDPKVKLIVCSIKAAGVGLTLTASSRVGFIEFPWTYADCEQCEDRAHRIGQKDSVTCYYFLGKNTIDGKIYKIIQTKKAIAQAVTGSTEQIPENIVDMVANLFNQKDDEE
jgi:SWI/SNF-related matrix-associated actin-dependent regulator 1 of chromatin subfamily A